MEVPDRPTKGRTRPGRLRALDAYLVRYERALLEAPGPAPFVDLGFGETPVTTDEAAQAFWALNPTLPVIGLDRVSTDASAPFELRQGGLEAVPDGVRLLRVMNVLRAYPEDEARSAQAVLRAKLAPDGLLLEGTADPQGAILTCHLVRRGSARLLFFTDFSTGFAPRQLRDWLPRDLRRGVKPGTAISALLEEWTAAWEHERTSDPAQAFLASARQLGTFDDDGWLLEHGYARCAWPR